MSVLKKVVLCLGLSLLLTGCPHKTFHQKVESIVARHRGTVEWNRSKHAFKTIMREYVHGGRTDISDAELDADFEMYVKLSKEDVEEFLSDQTCLPRPGTEESSPQFYMANSTHQRHDGFFKTNQPRHAIAGSGSKHAHATFTANLLLERTPISPTATFPERAKLEGNPFSDWGALSEALTDEARFKEIFLFKDVAQAEAVLAATQALDFAGSVSGELFMAPTLKGGDVFSPALYAVYLLRSEPASSPSVYVVVSANAQGEPETPYVGLIDSAGSPYESVTGFAFTYLSTPKNLLSYELELTGESPLAFEMRITTAYPDHPDKPYLTVRSTFVPAVSKETVAKYRDSRLTRLILMIRKGALMRDLIRLYYPDSKEVELWNDVGAIHGTRFRNKLEAAGLNLAVDLFDRDLWLEKPKVGGAAPLEFKVAPDAISLCSAGP